MAFAPSLDYGELGWVKIGDYPFWPTRRADILEAPPEVKKYAREELMLVYFFGARTYAWIPPEKARLWDETIEKQNDTQRRSKLLQSALDEAYEWQKDFLKKKFSTRRRSSVQPGEKSRDFPAALMSEVKSYRRALENMMKSQEKEWRDTRRKGGDVSPDEAEPAVLPPRRAASASSSPGIISPITLKKPRKPPVKKISAPNSGRSSLAASGALSPAPSPSPSPSPAPPSPADAKAVVAEMLKTEEEADQQGFGVAVLESLAAAAMESDNDDDHQLAVAPAAVLPVSPPPTPASPLHQSLISAVLETASAPAEMEGVVSTTTDLPTPASGLRTSTLLRKRMGKRPHSALTSPGGPELSSSVDMSIDVLPGIVTSTITTITTTTTPPPPPAADAEESLEPPAKKRAIIAPEDNSEPANDSEGVVAPASTTPSSGEEQRQPQSTKSSARAVAEDIPSHADASQHCPMCGNTAHSYKSTVVDPTAEEMAVDERPHDRAENESLGKYMFYVLENHFANLACGEKYFVCPYPNCQSKFSIEFELKRHIDAVHVRELQRNLLLQPHPDANSSLEPVYSISLDCDYHGCDATFPGTEAGRLERRRHIESVHLQLHKHQCECCDTPVYGSEANERRRQAELAGIPLKRGRGRPRKYPRPGENLPIPQPLLGPDGNPIKRGRGRPRKYPRSGDYDNGFDNEQFDGLGGVRSSPDGGSRDKRGPGRPRKSSAGAYGIDSAASGSDSEMENSSYDQSLKGSRVSPHGGEKRGRMGARGEPSSVGHSRSRSGSPSTKRGPGRPRKYPRDEFGHPIKPPQAGQNHRPSKRRKHAAALLAAQIANGVSPEEAKRRIKSPKQSPGSKTEISSAAPVAAAATSTTPTKLFNASSTSVSSNSTDASTTSTTPSKSSTTSSSIDAMDVDTPPVATSTTPPTPLASVPAIGKQSGKKKKKKKKATSKKLLSPTAAATATPPEPAALVDSSSIIQFPDETPTKKFPAPVEMDADAADVSDDDRDGDYLEKSKHRGSPKKPNVNSRPIRNSPVAIGSDFATPKPTSALISLNTIDSATPIFQAVVANLKPPPATLATTAAPDPVAPVVAPTSPAALVAPQQEQVSAGSAAAIASVSAGLSLFFGLADLCAAAEIEEPSAPKKG